MFVMASDKKPKKPNRTGMNINTWIDEDIAKSFTAFIDSQRAPPKRTTVLELALQEFLKNEGYYPLPAPGQPIRPVPRGSLSPVPLSLPILGTTAAGVPIEVGDEAREWFDFNQRFGGEDRFILRVEGDSMIDAHICPGDHVVIRHTPEAQVGEDVIAWVDGHYTLKRLKKRGERFVLVPMNGNERYWIDLKAERGDRIDGVLIGVIRITKH